MDSSFEIEGMDESLVEVMVSTEQEYKCETCGYS